MLTKNRWENANLLKMCSVHISRIYIDVGYKLDYHWKMLLVVCWLRANRPGYQYVGSDLIWHTAVLDHKPSWLLMTEDVTKSQHISVFGLSHVIKGYNEICTTESIAMDAPPSICSMVSRSLSLSNMARRPPAARTWTSLPRSIMELSCKQTKKIFPSRN